MPRTENAFVVDQRLGEWMNVSDTDVMEFARQNFGISAADLVAGFRELRGEGVNVDLREYVLFELFDRNKRSIEDCRTFISERLHWQIVSQCCDMSWFAVTEDKFLTETLLRTAGVRTPEVLAVVDRTIRSYPGKTKISNLADLQKFLAALGGRPFFGKMLRSMSAYGAFLCDRYNESHVHIRGMEPISIQEFLEDFIGNNVYVFQPVVENHPFFDVLSPNLATVRLVVLVFDNQVNLAFSVLKIPAGQNVVDSAVRKGNYVCEVDGKDGGRIVSIVTTGPLIAKRSEVFPPTGADIIGQKIPYWDEVMRMAAQAASVFSPVRLQSIDVAITKEGPSIIEVNTGSSFNMIQRATGRGFLQPEVAHLLNVAGVKFDHLDRFLPSVEGLRESGTVDAD